MSAVARTGWARRALLAVAVLVVLAPAFGWASGAVGYAEPLENAAEATGASGSATAGHGVFPDYGVPGVPAPMGTLLAGAVGTGLTLAVGVGVGRALES